MNKDEKILKQFTSKEYEHGWSVDLDVDQAPNGLNENIIKLISKKKNEPDWLLRRTKLKRQCHRRRAPGQVEHY